MLVLSYHPSEFEGSRTSAAVVILAHRKSGVSTQYQYRIGGVAGLLLRR